MEQPGPESGGLAQLAGAGGGQAGWRCGLCRRHIRQRDPAPSCLAETPCPGPWAAWVSISWAACLGQSPRAVGEPPGPGPQHKPTGGRSSMHRMDQCGQGAGRALAVPQPLGRARDHGDPGHGFPRGRQQGHPEDGQEKPCTAGDVWGSAGLFWSETSRAMTRGQVVSRPRAFTQLGPARRGRWHVLTWGSEQVTAQSAYAHHQSSTKQKTATTKHLLLKIHGSFIIGSRKIFRKRGNWKRGQESAGGRPSTQGRWPPEVASPTKQGGGRAQRTGGGGGSPPGGSAKNSSSQALLGFLQRGAAA